MDKPLKILVGVCGGVAAYKSVDLVSRLRKAGHEVHVAMSDAATKFVTPLTFAAVSGRRVLGQLFTSGEEGELEDLYPHLYPATEADVFILVPATADMMSQIVHGAGRDVVSTSALSLPAHCQRIFCPAMNVEMWEQATVQQNVNAMERLGWQRIGPESGHLACGTEGSGRMSEPETIFNHVMDATGRAHLLANKRVLILSGPTREHFDPIRYIGNPSSGKMGKAIAEEASLAVAEIDFISGPVAREHLPCSDQIQHHPVVSADDMLAKATELFDLADVIIYVAAVADYTPVTFHEKKMPKQDGAITLEFKNTPDIAATLCARKKPSQIAIGFALQTHDGEKEATGKLEKKNLDGIVLNYVDALGADDGNYRFLTNLNGASGFQEWGHLNKRDCARKIIDAVEAGKGA